jgi:DNA-binding winged helix-turn-helix (wHTH) protein/tetratricopeptide (TPR) repeat protein
MKDFPPFRLDEVNQCLWRRDDRPGEQRILLTPKAFGVLHYLVQHAGRLVTQDELLEALWPNTFVQPEVLKSHIRDIRAALGDDAKTPRFIETLPRRGYLFIAPIRDLASQSPLAPDQPARKLVGRKTALGQLTTSMQAAMHGQCQIVFVTGEPGIGKTTLVDEFQRDVASKALPTLMGRGQCMEGYGGIEAYYPMLEALGQLCYGPAGDSVVQILASQAPTWLVQFPALVKREQRETLHREIVGATRERMLREISDALETIASKNALVLVFEDLHWADHSTVDLISALARRRRSARIMFAGTVRPVEIALSDHPLKALKQDLLIHRLCHEIVLDPLDEAEVAEYLAAECGGAAVPEGLARLIYRHTEGNPLFMVAALEHMRERKLITQQDGCLTLTLPLHQIELRAPESLRQLIEVRIERLSKEETRALEVASVTGTLFATAVTAFAANMDVEHFENLCEGLARRHQILRPADPQHLPAGHFSERYEFVHGLYREIVYDSLSHGRRAKMHLCVGAGLEECFSKHENEVAAELAEHFEQAGTWPRAVKYLQLAAHTASRRFEPRQAAEILERALELVKRLPDGERAECEIEVLENLATIYVASGDPRVEEAYQALVARATHYGMLDVQVRALLAWAFFVSWMSSQRCLDVLESTLPLSASQGDALLRARTRARCFALGVWAVGWNSRRVEEFRDAFTEILKNGDRRILAPHLVDCGFIMWISSEYREARRNLIESREILFETIQENPYLDTAYLLGQCVLCMNLLFLGEWGEALREIEDTIVMVDKNAQSTWGQALRLYQAWVHLHAMDFAGALAICNSALPLVKDPKPRPAPDSATPYPFEFWMCLVLTGIAETELGNYESALEHLLVAQADMGSQEIMIGWYWRMPLEFALAELWLAKGDLARARPQAERFLEIALTNAERTWQALAWEVNARVAIAELDATRARDCIATGLSTMEGFEVPLAAWRVHATAFELYQNSGHRDLAGRHLALSRDTILKLANSLPEEEPLRKIFLSAPMVRKVLGEAVA